MFEDTRPAELHDDGPDPWAPFRVTDRHEIVALLRQLRDGSVPLVASTPDGATIGTELWSLDSHAGTLNFSADHGHPQLQRLLAADEVTAVGYLDSIKLQFDLHDLVLVHGAQGCTLRAPLPEAVYRFQRRGAFRVRPLERHAPTARFRHPSIPDMALALRVVDISVGGCALFLPHDVPALAPGVAVNVVGVELDADTRFDAALRIQHISSLAPAEGVRAGCEWVRLDSDAQRALQRYINQTQKRRRLLAFD